MAGPARRWNASTTTGAKIVIVAPVSRGPQKIATFEQGSRRRRIELGRMECEPGPKPTLHDALGDQGDRADEEDVRCGAGSAFRMMATYVANNTSASVLAGARAAHGNRCRGTRRQPQFHCRSLSGLSRAEGARRDTAPHNRSSTTARPLNVASSDWITPRSTIRGPRRDEPARSAMMPGHTRSRRSRWPTIDPSWTRSTSLSATWPAMVDFYRELGVEVAPTISPWDRHHRTCPARRDSTSTSTAPSSHRSGTRVANRRNRPGARVSLRIARGRRRGL